MNLEVIKSEIKREIEISEITNWQKGKILIDFPPFKNRGITMSQLIINDSGKYVRLIKLSEELSNAIYQFVLENNQDSHLNQIVFEVPDTNLENVTIEAIFNEEVDAKFRKNIPKNYKGSTLPWWKNPEEVKGLI